jgi:hypothetical protein
MPPPQQQFGMGGMCSVITTVITTVDTTVDTTYGACSAIVVELGNRCC